MKNYQNKRNGLLQLGLIVSLGSTLVGFEYANVDVRTNQVRTNKMTDLEIETVYDEIEIKKPEVPKPPVQNPTPVVNPNPTPTPTPGPIIISPNPVPDPGFDPFVDPNLDPIGRNIGKQEIVIDLPIDVGMLEEFPTYEEFVSIQEKEERRLNTEAKLINYVQSKAKYPRIPNEMGIQGTVHVSFIVDKSGNITEVGIARGVHPDLDNEAMEAVKKLPKMIPGKQLDKPVRVKYIIPVKFKLK